MTRTAAQHSEKSTSRRRGVAALASGTLLATGLVLVPGTASANGDCVQYWAADTGSWSGAPANGGDGSAENPYKVASESDLSEARWCPDKHFRQIADVTLTPGWLPIRGEGAADGQPFTGVYDGGGYAISGLAVDEQSTDDVGLFRVIAGSGKVTDLALNGVDVAGRTRVGALAGSVLESAEVSKLAVNGTVQGLDTVGGLVGFLSSTPPASQSDAAVAGPTVTDAASSATVTASDVRVGGIVGSGSSATISKSATSGSITGRGYIGGVIGYGESMTLRELATDVTVTATAYAAGGLAGLLDGESAVSDSATAGSAQVTNNGGEAGGLIGVLGGLTTVTDTASDVAASARYNAGGLIGAGYEYPTITRSVAAGAVTGEYSTGGLIGGHSSGAITITDSAASGAVTGGLQVGGLGGIVVGKIHRSSASGTVTATGDDVGGLVGVLAADSDVCNGAATVCAAIPAPEVPIEIRASHASGAVTGRSRVGGLVGLLADNALCPTAQTAENVQSCAASTAPSATVIDAYSTGKVTATQVAGGLIGSTGDLQIERGAESQLPGVAVAPSSVVLTVTNTYTSGVVSGATRGGVLGEDPGNATVIESFWDATADPGLTGAKGVGKTQAQLRDITTFTKAQWLIQAGAPATGNNVWGICVPPDPAVHQGYPFLLWQHTQINPCHPVPAAPVLKSLTPGNRTLGVTAELRADGGNPVTKVQYRLDGGPWTDSGGASGSFTITGLTNGKTYKVQVRAINAIGASDASNTLSGTPTGAATVLKVNGLDKGDRLPVDERSVLVRSVRTNGQVVVARVFCTLRGNRLPPRLRERLCSPTVTGPAATAADVTAAAKTRKKKLRITAKPDCSAGLKVHVTIAAKAKGAPRKVFTRSFRVDNKPTVKCRIKGTG